MRFRRKSRRGKFANYAALSQQVKDNADTSLWRFLLDTRVGEAQQLGTIIGLPPMTPDDAAEEQDESDWRVSQVDPLVPLLSMYASVMTGSVMEYLSMTTDVAADQNLAAVSGLIRSVTLATTVGAIAQLEDLGLIRYTYERTT